MSAIPEDWDYLGHREFKMGQRSGKPKKLATRKLKKEGVNKKLYRSRNMFVPTGYKVLYFERPNGVVVYVKRDLKRKRDGSSLTIKKIKGI